jgi:tetratricopeptide (TPR) repeat protein
VLEDNSLVDRRPGGRWSMHDLVRAYAATTARDELTEAERRAALERVVSFYLHTSHHADRLLNPHRDLVPLDPPAEGVALHPPAGASAAMTWFDSEHAVLLAAQRTAADHARHSAAWHLAWTLNTFQVRRGRLHDNLAVWSTALAAAAHLPDPTTRIHAHRRLGHAHTALGRPEEGLAHLRQALALAEQDHDTAQRAHTHRALAGALERLGEDLQALEHATRMLDLYRGGRGPRPARPFQRRPRPVRAGPRGLAGGTGAVPAAGPRGRRRTRPAATRRPAEVTAEPRDAEQGTAHFRVEWE